MIGHLLLANKIKPDMSSISNTLCLETIIHLKKNVKFHYTSTTRIHNCFLYSFSPKFIFYASQIEVTVFFSFLINNIVLCAGVSVREVLSVYLFSFLKLQSLFQMCTFSK